MHTSQVDDPINLITDKLVLKQGPESVDVAQKIWTISTKYYSCDVQLVPVKMDLAVLVDGGETACVDAVCKAIYKYEPTEALIYYFKDESVSPLPYLTLSYL